MIRKEQIETIQSRYKFMTYKAGEHITSDEIFQRGIALCSHCGYPMYLDQLRCDACMQSKFILTESTTEYIDNHYSFINKNYVMVLGFLKGFYVDGQRKPTDFVKKIKTGIKLHTIRWDQNNRWKPGRKIHFATGARTSKYKQFHKGLCLSTQKIVIERREIWIDDVKLSEDEIEYLSINDGFDSVSDFWWWFDQYTPITGKIIHWTDLSY